MSRALQGRLRKDGAIVELSLVELRVQLWNVNQQATEAEGSPLLRFITRKHLVKTLQRNSHYGELSSSKD
jgi:hypothetical protein